MTKQTENRIARLIENARKAGLVVIDETTTDDEGYVRRSVRIEETYAPGTLGETFREQYEITGREDLPFTLAFDWTVRSKPRGKKGYSTTIREIERWVSWKVYYQQMTAKDAA
jgi:hypothetical protein